MITPSHGILAMLSNKGMNRRWKTRVPWFYAVFGSILPDLFHISDAVLGWIAVKLFQREWHWELLIDTGKFFHSVPVFTLVFTLFISLTIIFRGRVGGYSRIVAFLWGWGFFHILVDMLTHRALGWPYFWPWTDVRISGLTDHSQIPLLVIELLVSFSVLIYWTIKWLIKNHRRNHS